VPENPREPPAGALAHGPAKADDIESTRRDLKEVERYAARELHAAALRHEPEREHPDNDSPGDPFAT
jgi:hypothetical protein